MNIVKINELVREYTHFTTTISKCHQTSPVLHGTESLLKTFDNVDKFQSSQICE